METIIYAFRTYALPELILIIGLCLFFVAVPKRAALKGYRMARRIMGTCYLLLFATLVVQLVGFHLVMPFVVIQMIRISDAILQAFFFTFALTILIDVSFFSWKTFLTELLIIVQAILLTFSAYFLLPTSTPAVCQYLPFGCLLIFYVYKLVRYVFHFCRHYRDYERRMENFFSDDESKRLKWVKMAFYQALFIGVFALVNNVFPSRTMGLLFMLAVMIYYLSFGLRFISYAFMFQKIEVALMCNESEATTQEGESADVLHEEQVVLMLQLDKLMAEKRLYTNPNLVIEDVAVLMGVSLRTVSAAINNIKGTNFRGWVNSYRVQEAEKMIAEGYLTAHTTDAIATVVGFTNRVNFYRAFKKITGKSPTER